MILSGVLLEFAAVNRFERKAIEARLRKNHVTAAFHAEFGIFF